VPHKKAAMKASPASTMWLAPLTYAAGFGDIRAINV
jgi:hypothetical protein